MGSMAMPAVAIREEIHLEMDDAQFSEENVFTDTLPTVGEVETQRVQLHENNISVNESGAIVRPVIALRGREAHGQLDINSMVQDSGSTVSAAMAIRNLRWPSMDPFE